MGKITNNKFSIQEAFNSCSYVVPDYQREYVWEEKNIIELLDDIKDEFELDAKSEYFIGTVIVAKNEDKYELIDGQQRLTSIFLSLSAFAQKLGSPYLENITKTLSNTKINDDGDIVPEFKLELQYENTQDFIEQIINTNIDKLIGETDEDELKGSKRNLFVVYKTIFTYLKQNFKDDAELKKFYAYFSNKINFIQIETDISSALKIFETINSKGVGLNPMDLLKNLIFRQVKKEQFNTIKVEWKKIINLLEKDKKKPLRFLRYFIMANYKVKNAKGEAIVREDEIYTWITDSENAKQCNYEKAPFDFVKKMQQNVKDYINFSKGKDINGDNNPYLDNIKYLSGSSSQHLVLLLAARDLPKETFNYLVKQIEVLLFYYLITKTQTKDLERKLSVWAEELREICKLDNKTQKSKINDFVKENFLIDLKEKNNRFKTSFIELYSGELQKYRLKYILAKLSQYVDNEYLTKKEYDNLNQYLEKEIEIEHILPNNPTAELKNEFEEKYGKDEYDEWSCMLGNLTLLEKPINGAIGRDYFDLKKPEYSKSNIRLTKSISKIENVGKNTAINRINGYLKSFDEWNKETIQERQEMLFNLATNVWKLEELN